MPNPIPLATKEEEERRAWVTQHHEVVRLVKDCFGDRFSNNEIFDRLKISRRTGYRALGNDDRIGKAPGRKPKISETIIKEIIDYIEAGGCDNGGNIWKHVQEKFAPDCNPKTVQDAVKKFGFKNYRDTVKLEPLLNQTIPDGSSTPLLDDQVQQFQSVQQEMQIQHDQHNAIDPAFHQPSVAETLAHAIATAPEGHVRFVLQEICRQYAVAGEIASHYLYTFAPAPPMPQVQQMALPQMHHELQQESASPDGQAGKRQRMAICRRCNHQFDRTDNTMEKRNCLYHKGSPQKISPEEVGTIEQTPEAFIWSCCGGNGMVRGCCRAMHTTKKKRTYGKKRSATAAGLDGEDSELENGMLEGVGMGVDMEDPNIDARLQELDQAGLQQQQQQQQQQHEHAMMMLQPLNMESQLAEHQHQHQQLDVSQADIHHHLQHQHQHHLQQPDEGLQGAMDPELQGVGIGVQLPADVQLQLEQA